MRLIGAAIVARDCSVFCRHRLERRQNYRRHGQDGLFDRTRPLTLEPTATGPSRAAFARAEPFLSIIVIVWRIRPSMRSTPRVHDLGREKHIIARPAQPRTVASQAGSNPIDVRNVGPAEAKSVRCAGLSLLVRPLSDRRRFSVKQERKRCDAAGDWMLWPHTGALGENVYIDRLDSSYRAKMSNSRLLNGLDAQCSAGW